MYYIGMMSGTSLDGIDLVLVSFSPQPRLISSLLYPFPPELKLQLQQLSQPGDNEIERLGLTEQQLANCYASGVKALLAQAGVAASTIAAIGCHGQTIRHRPDASFPFSYQIGDMHRLAMLCHIPVIADFRRKDIAYGGQGAPLVPAFHRAVFQHPNYQRAIVNIGGIANVSVLSADRPVTGFDTGPGNALLDNWVMQCRKKSYDNNGEFCSEGQLMPELLTAMLADPYFSKPAPKSTGREYFNLAWLQQFEPERFNPADVQRTLCRLTAQSISNSLQNKQLQQVFVCGGGVHNRVLMADLALLLPNCTLSSTQTLGVNPDWVEALAFAWLAWAYQHNVTGNLPEVTGASKACVLGVAYFP
ncbi:MULTISPECIES: anhydro-N-acetylmuramic acid kinase [unclassified Arsukibacterium]|uniref:anhydro-N-acetylmuramic acid kinase n=1 Tax=unclassified Arsukibacterium TaxID=2635278 RepID=UPI000C98A384|nr:MULTISPECIES: anhydro-N-acetylmuramic acid kinase [unclassified Arsukibacterium]MAA95223.1 anhydro-N-acetylmuramic acid kinase [Rheinheimera sp.]HAW92605.1 anhydro-N-acetylmuramic acid kinase [Candidatus Azambacteria bacterium]|tara:strand:- start:22412 stop:23494 length:1083 start_codon:yes stop_codon:yes gene_type:complete